MTRSRLTRYHKSASFSANTMVPTVFVFALALAAAQATGYATSNQNFNLVSKNSHPIPVHTSHGHGYDYYDPHAHYNFHYSVHDLHTGDIKSQHETRLGDKVEGEYSLREADGSTRTVKYTSDAHSGFNAHVHRQQNIHPQIYHSAPVRHPSYHY